MLDAVGCGNKKTYRAKWSGLGVQVTVRVHLTEKVGFEQRPEGGGALAKWITGGHIQTRHCRVSGGAARLGREQNGTG